MSFAKAAATYNTARTQNDMKALRASENPCVDLFYKIGASRGKNIIPEFVAAYRHNKDVALRIAQWARDVRGGAGERQIFRDILGWLEKNDQDAAIALTRKIPEIGRYDDLLVFTEDAVKQAAFGEIKKAIDAGNGLAAKWLPRQGSVATELSRFLGFGVSKLPVLPSKKEIEAGLATYQAGRTIEVQSKAYRKTLVRLTKVVESQMCAKDWENINFSHVPSLASSRYKKAFARHSQAYRDYVAKLVSGDKSVKVNASAVYPYDVLKGRINSYGLQLSKTDLDHIQAQWEALPNYMGAGNVLPLVDVSGSMTAKVANNKNLSCLEVAVSLGLYCADKNTGAFKDMFINFSGNPRMNVLTGKINMKIDQMVRSEWQMNTDLHRAMDLILNIAVKGKVDQKDMPQTLLILSDMQFDRCVAYDDSAIEMVRRKFESAGYEVPQVVFWNLNAYDNTPVTFDTSGTALVSGFSPAILKAVLASDLETFTPESVMLKAVMIERYALH